MQQRVRMHCVYSRAVAKATTAINLIVQSSCIISTLQQMPKQMHILWSWLTFVSLLLPFHLSCRNASSLRPVLW
jgi:hypothetical protein